MSLEVLETGTVTGPNAREMTAWERFFFRIRMWWAINIGRRLPRLVWPGDEVDVRVTFKNHGLGNWSDDLHSVESGLRRMGLGFDTGAGRAGRDWEWDYSLSGPVSITFRSRAKKPERRKNPPRPTLVVANSTGG